MASIKDDKGHNQGFRLAPSTMIRMKRRASLLLPAQYKSSKSKLLEIGCGTGEIAFWIAEKNPTIKVTGTDICKPFIEQAQQNFKLPNLEYRHLDINTFEKDPGQYDIIIGNGILHHVYPNLEHVLKSLQAKLNFNGQISFMEPNILNPYCMLIFNISFLRKWANLEPDEMAFSRKFIQDKLKKTGFVDINVTYNDFLVPGVPLFMVKPILFLEKFFENIPFTRIFAQSLLISAKVK